MNAGYGSLYANALTPHGTGKTFYVTASTGKSAQLLQNVFPVDNDGDVRVFATIALALAATVAGRGDSIVIASDYTTAATDAELATAGANGVTFVQGAAGTSANEVLVTGTSKALPATTAADIFTIT